MDDDNEDGKNTAGVTCSVLPNALILCFSCFWISEAAGASWKVQGARWKVQGERWKVIHNVISIANLGSNLCSKCINYITKVNIIMDKSPHTEKDPMTLVSGSKLYWNFFLMFVSFLALEYVECLNNPNKRPEHYCKLFLVIFCFPFFFFCEKLLKFIWKYFLFVILQNYLQHMHCLFLYLFFLFSFFICLVVAPSILLFYFHFPFWFKYV